MEYELEDIEYVRWLFDRYLAVILMTIGPDRQRFAEEGLDEETARGLRLGLKSRGYSMGIGWKLKDGEFAGGRKFLIVEFLLLKQGRPGEPEIDSRFIGCLLPSEDIETILTKLETLKKKIPRIQEIGILTVEENEEFIKSLGIATPES